MVPKLLRDLPQWLVWKFEATPGEEKPRKVPYYIDGARRVGKQGDEKDRGRLMMYDQALEATQRARYDGLGFAFLPDDGLAGVDLDKVIDGETGEIKPGAMRILKALDSYTEKSPSGRGLHIFVTTELTGRFKSFKRNALGVEVFCSSQFFTFTGEHYSGTPAEIRPLSKENRDRLLKTVKGVEPSSTVAASAPLWRTSESDEQRRAEAALAYVPADEYQVWIDIGHVLKNAFGEAGFSIWDRWSQKSAKYPSMTESAKKWATFNPNGSLTLGTVFELAKRAGWSPPRAPKNRQRADNPSGPPGEAPPAGSDAGDPGEPGDSRPLIKWVQGRLPEIVDQAERALLESGLRIYQRAGFLVRVVKRDTPSVRHYKRRPPGALGIMTVDTPYLVEAFTRAARWQKWNEKKGDWLPSNAPEQAAVTHLARRGHWKLPVLWSAISSPTLRPDGTVLQKPGYDAEMQSWYDPCGIKFPQIPEQPSKDDAIAALARLEEAFQSFPFESNVDKAVALSLALTALVRRSLPAAPLGGITAPVMESGKTLLADCFSILAVGVSAPAMTYAATDEEMTKTLLAILAEGDQVLLIDNIERTLQGEALCAVLTSEVYRQRMLGRTEMMNVPTTTLFLATGNHLVIAGDLRTRALMCRIDPKVERPGERQFEVEKREWMMQHRPELVAAGLTIMRAFIATEQRSLEHCKTWGRFERWSDMVRAPLIWLGCEDPCASLKYLELEDPERNELLRVTSAWEKVFQADPHTARDAVDAANKARNDPPELAGAGAELDLALRDVCKGRDGALDPKRLGHWLRTHGGRYVDGKHFVRAGERDHTLLWKVEAMKNT